MSIFIPRPINTTPPTASMRFPTTDERMLPSLIYKKGGRKLVLSARDMTTEDRKIYEQR